MNRASCEKSKSVVVNPKSSQDPVYSVVVPFVIQHRTKMCIDHDMSYEHAGKRSAVPGKGFRHGVSHVVVRVTEYFGDGGEPTPLCHLLSRHAHMAATLRSGIPNLRRQDVKTSSSGSEIR